MNWNYAHIDLGCYTIVLNNILAHNLGPYVSKGPQTSPGAAQASEQTLLLSPRREQRA